jgi:hypothetical protein
MLPTNSYLLLDKISRSQWVCYILISFHRSFYMLRSMLVNVFWNDTCKQIFYVNSGLSSYLVLPVILSWLLRLFLKSLKKILKSFTIKSLFLKFKQIQRIRSGLPDLDSVQSERWLHCSRSNPDRLIMIGRWRLITQK